MSLAALRTFALVARAYGWQPRDLGRTEAQQIDKDFQGNKRESDRGALTRLDELRMFPDLLKWLPVQPICFTADARAPRLIPLAPRWEEQCGKWIEAVTKSGWDSVDQTFADDHQGHAHVMRSAFRTFLRIAVETRVLSQEECDLRTPLADDEAICTVAAEMFARRLRSKRHGRLEPRTSRKYIKAVNQVRGHLGIDTTLLSQVLANNAVAREGKKADKRMTAKNRAFCEMLVEKRPMRRRFITCFQVLRKEAETLLSRAVLEKRELTGQERARVRLLGASACFAAIEIGGAPIRV